MTLPTLMALADSTQAREISEALFRWIHVVAGVVWIGMLYFFNFVNTPFVATMDGETKKKVVPQLMPRALFWFRWGAAFTWITGLLLMGLVYYMTSALLADPLDEGSKGKVSMVGLGGILLGFFVYDILAKSLAKQPLVALWIWWLIALGFAFGLMELGASARTAYIHLGALFGTAMAANVWMRIWPAQQRIITAVKNGQAPNPADPAMAGLRSKHNTFMSVPLIATMLVFHMTVFTGMSQPLLPLAGILVVAFLATQWLYGISAKVQGF